jgi:hypothetical protein
MDPFGTPMSGAPPNASIYSNPAFELPVVSHEVVNTRFRLTVLSSVDPIDALNWVSDSLYPALAKAAIPDSDRKKIGPSLIPYFNGLARDRIKQARVKGLLDPDNEHKALDDFVKAILSPGVFGFASSDDARAMLDSLESLVVNSQIPNSEWITRFNHYLTLFDCLLDTTRPLDYYDRMATCLIRGLRDFSMKSKVLDSWKASKEALNPDDESLTEKSKEALDALIQFAYSLIDDCRLLNPTSHQSRSLMEQRMAASLGLGNPNTTPTMNYVANSANTSAPMHAPMQLLRDC